MIAAICSSDLTLVRPSLCAVLVYPFCSIMDSVAYLAKWRLEPALRQAFADDLCA